MQPPYTPAKNSSEWWARTLRIGGCLWANASGGGGGDGGGGGGSAAGEAGGGAASCVAFTCEEAAATPEACHKLAHPNNTLYPTGNYIAPKSCQWDSASGSCTALTPAEFCAKVCSALTFRVSENCRCVV
jgi:hypothetical protein